MFTVEQREALRERVVALAESDPRVVAGAIVGSLALGGGDRHSDLDLTFAVAEGVPVGEVISDWTGTLHDELDALPILDLERPPTTFRVFLFPDALQFDLSLTPASRFAPTSPRFRLLFGTTAEGLQTDGHKPPPAADLFGWGVIYGLHSRTCIERGRLWAAEHYIGQVRDHALSLACLRRGLPAVQARGYDDLPADLLAHFAQTHIAALEPTHLQAALRAAMGALLNEGVEAGVPGAAAVAERLTEFR